MAVYRNAVATDGAALDRMARRVWLATYGQDVPAEDVAAYLGAAFGPRGTLARDMADPAFDYRIALEGGEVIGFAKIGPSEFGDEVPDTAGALQLRRLYVDRQFHGMGVSHDLLDWAKHRAAARGAGALVLGVGERNARAIAFYTKHGFAPVGAFPYRVGRQVDRDIVMRVAL